MLELSPVDRKIVRITVTGTKADGTPATITGLDVALLPIGTRPTAATAWLQTAYSAGVGVALLVGAEADPTGGLVVRAPGGDLWVRTTDAPEVDAVFVARVRG